MLPNNFENEFHFQVSFKELIKYSQIYMDSVLVIKPTKGFERTSIFRLLNKLAILYGLNHT